jgi:hypothetical protein
MPNKKLNDPAPSMRPARPGMRRGQPRRFRARIFTIERRLDEVGQQCLDANQADPARKKSQSGGNVANCPSSL